MQELVRFLKLFTYEIAIHLILLSIELTDCLITLAHELPLIAEWISHWEIRPLLMSKKDLDRHIVAA